MTDDLENIPLQAMEIECDSVEAKLAVGASVCLIDVRENWEYDRDHLEGAHHIPLGLLGLKIMDIQDLAKQHQEVITICEHGMRSLDAAWYLKQEGIASVSSMKGGMAEWRQTVNSRIVSGSD